MRMEVTCVCVCACVCGERKVSQGRAQTSNTSVIIVCMAPGSTKAAHLSLVRVFVGTVKKRFTSIFFRTSAFKPQYYTNSRCTWYDVCPNPLFHHIRMQEVQ